MAKMTRLHKVREGDTMMSICLTYGVKYKEILVLNPEFTDMGYRNPSLLYPGEVIVVGLTDVDPLDLVRDRRKR